MLKAVKKIFLFLGLFLGYFIVKEFISLYSDLYSIEPWLAYSFSVVSLGVFIYFAAIPSIQIYRIPKFHPPATNESEKEAVIKARMKAFRKNKQLSELNNLHVNSPDNEETYRIYVSHIKTEVSKVRSKYVNGVFYATAISQNGFIDSMMMISASVNMVKEIFILYSGRSSVRDLWAITKTIYFTAAFAATESVEYITDEIISKLGSETAQKIPFLNILSSSLVEGYVNALLLTRIALITENYCNELTITNRKQLLPALQTVNTTTKHITKEIFDKLNKVTKTWIVDKGKDKLNKGVDKVSAPVKILMQKAVDVADSETAGEIKAFTKKISNSTLGKLGSFITNVKSTKH